MWLQVIAWTIAVLVISINMYLLLVTVLSRLANSTPIIVILTVIILFYVCFVIYLVLDPAQEDGNWVYFKRTFLSSRSAIFLTYYDSYMNFHSFNEYSLDKSTPLITILKSVFALILYSCNVGLCSDHLLFVNWFLELSWCLLR